MIRFFFFFSSRRRHTRLQGDWSSDVCSSDLDRLLDPLERDPSVAGGFRAVSWDHALDRVVAEIRRIQAEHGPDAFAVLSGVSLTNEKSYLVGKFARLAVGTANLDYNGRFCMVSAGVGSKKAL